MTDHARQQDIEYNTALAQRDRAWAALRVHKEELQRIAGLPPRRWDSLNRSELIRRALRIVVGELQWREATIDRPVDPHL
jgi:hypothetical protein